MKLLIYFSTILSLLLICNADPIEDFFRNFALTTRQIAEKVFANIHIPNMEEVNNNNVMFSMDPKTVNAVGSLSEFINTCPPSVTPNMAGTWAILFVSKRMLQTLLSDVDQAISLLSSGRPLETRKSIGSLFRASIAMECASIVVVNSSMESQFQFAYTSSYQPRSIIGQIRINGDRSMDWQFAPTVTGQFATIYSSQIGAQSASDTIVLAQVDTFPRCDNVMVLSRTRNSDSTRAIIDQLTQSGQNFPSNPLIPIMCPSENGPIGFQQNTVEKQSNALFYT